MGRYRGRTVGGACRPSRVGSDGRMPSVNEVIDAGHERCVVRQKKAEQRRDFLRPPEPVAAALHGMLTGVGGGMMRDVLVREITVVLRADFYAVAALSGAAVVVAGHLLHWPPVPAAVGGAAVCFFMRFTAIRRGWRLPVAHHAGHSSSDG